MIEELRLAHGAAGRAGPLARRSAQPVAQGHPLMAAPFPPDLIERLTSLLDDLPDAVRLLDRGGHVLLRNEASELLAPDGLGHLCGEDAVEPEPVLSRLPDRRGAGAGDLPALARRGAAGREARRLLRGDAQPGARRRRAHRRRAGDPARRHGHAGAGAVPDRPRRDPGRRDPQALRRGQPAQRRAGRAARDPDRDPRAGSAARAEPARRRASPTRSTRRWARCSPAPTCCARSLRRLKTETKKIPDDAVAIGITERLDGTGDQRQGDGRGGAADRGGSQDAAPVLPPGRGRA